MRPVLHGDVTSVARALLLVGKEAREGLCQHIFVQADQAEEYVRLSGRLHSSYGNGSLMSAARYYKLADEPSFDNIEYCQCFALVLHRLMTRYDP
ncbi:hypothetical protein [Parasedimentitalea huanghaiensis]|uniref:DUF7742 domain-containing protein n=1 Tax=Parasedimentitalea huanghaiensis TaxID=2682100 RepID=A0A6L6WDT4_9RHOB|nr:hypothetical protein [Zongyanglinia huanghaiensis]MVO14735.1 hypothetical protein [Zongyanglinia huanghaiensis]